jgi:enamine deaminase RidA (YjgF/YER057c/UK114 family)
MAVRLTNVSGLSEPPGYAHVAIGSGRTLVFTAGQVPLDPDGNLVGSGDHRAQAEQVLRNLLWTLEAAGAGPRDVLKTTVFVVGKSHEAQSAVWDVVRSSPVGRSASTLVGVELLGYRGQLVEIEATAIIE